MPVVRFDGVNDGLSRTTTAALVSSGGGSIFAVRRFSAVPTAVRSVAWVSTNSAASPRLAIRGNATGKPESLARRLDADANTVVAGTTSVPTTFQIHGAVAAWSVGSVSQFIDGTAAGTGSISAGITSATSAAGIGIGRSASAAAYFAGDIAEVIIIRKALSACERQLIEGYLAHRWGLAASLPATHPFRNAAPTLADACGSLLDGGSEPDGNPTPVIEVAAGSGSLQPWIDRAPDGATLRVPAGIWTGAVTVSGKSLVLEAEAGAVETILDGEDQVGTVLSIVDGASVTVRGFAIRGGLGGTPVDLGDGRVRFAGGGVLIRDAEASIIECLVEGNLAGFGGGVAAIDAELDLVASGLRANHAAHEGGGLWTWASSACMLGGALRGNVAGASGGGISIDETSTVETFATEFCDNEPEDAIGPLEGEATSCEACAADLDRDGIVAAGDLAFLFGSWAEGGIEADLDGNGEVDAADLAVLIDAWDTACGP